MNTLHVVYDDAYNVPSFGEIAERYGRVLEILKRQVPLAIHAPANIYDVRVSHSPQYIESLTDPNTVRSIFELGEDHPSADDDVKAILRSQQLQYAGTLTAADLALQHGLAVNLGGGLHHASRTEGGGFCIYNDITACVDRLLETGVAKRVLIVDLDAHQGNGYEADLWDQCQKGQVCIFDAFEPMMFPFPAGESVKQSIHYFIPYLRDDRGDTFIEYLQKGIALAFDEFNPDFVIYNAGTDTMEGDPVTHLAQTSEAIRDRDLIIVETCRRAGVPVVMCMSGGYGEAVPQVVADSLAQIMAYPSIAAG